MHSAQSESPRFVISNPTPNEPLTRFVYSRSHFTTTRVKAGAFLPNAEGKTSVFRVLGLDRNYVQSTLSLAARNDRAAKGAAHFAVEHVLAVNLELDPNNIPERHADIISWPSDKEDKKERAQEIANNAEFEFYS